MLKKYFSEGSYSNDEECIYRVMKVEHLLSMIFHQELILVPPVVWDDPCEKQWDILLKAYNTTSESDDFNHLGSVNEVAKLYYAQCWSLHSESDVVWKQRLQNGEDAVSIKMNVESLRKIISSASIGDLNYMIEKVSYFSDEQIREAVSNPDNSLVFSGAKLGAASPFFAKRDAFAYENEVRLIVIAKDLPTTSTSKILVGRTPMLKISFSRLTVEELIKEIVFSPYMTEENYKQLEQAVKQINPSITTRRSRVREPLG